MLHKKNMNYSQYFFSIIFSILIFVIVCFIIPQHVHAEIFSGAPDIITVKTDRGNNFEIDVDYKEFFDTKTVVKKNKKADADVVILTKEDHGQISFVGKTNFDNEDTKIYLLDGKFKIVEDKENGGKKIKLGGDKISLFSGVTGDVLNFDIPLDVKNGKYQFIVIFTDDNHEIDYYYITKALVEKSVNKDISSSNSNSPSSTKVVKTIKEKKSKMTVTDNDDNDGRQNDELSTFTQIPSAIINSNNGTFEFGADFSSLDFGDKTQIIHNDGAKSANNMILNLKDDDLSLELNCDNDDFCGNGVSPEYVSLSL